MAQRACRERERSERLLSQSTPVLAQITVPAQIPEFLAEQAIQTNVSGSSSLPTMVRENPPHNLYEGNFVEGTSVQSTTPSIGAMNNITIFGHVRSFSNIFLLQPFIIYNLSLITIFLTTFLQIDNDLDRAVSRFSYDSFITSYFISLNLALHFFEFLGPNTSKKQRRHCDS